MSLWNTKNWKIGENRTVIWMHTRKSCRRKSHLKRNGTSKGKVEKTGKTGKPRKSRKLTGKQEERERYGEMFFPWKI
jgi:hypothetical protein